MLHKILFGIITLILFISPPAMAEDLNQYVEEDLHLVDSQLRGFSIADFSRSLQEGQGLPDSPSLLKKLWKLLGGEAAEAISTLAKLLIPILLYGILSAFSLQPEGEGVAGVAFLACYGVILGTVIHVFQTMTHLAAGAVESINILIKSLVPVLFTLVVTMGNLTQATMVQPTVLILSQVLIELINRVIFPMVLVSFALGITDQISGVMKLEYFGSLILKVVKWGLVFMMTLFVAIVSAQSLLGGSFDQIAVKGTKFAMSNFIPIVGGALAEGVETIGSSLLLIKNTTGIAGVAAMITVTVMPVIRIYCAVLMFHLLAALSQPITGERFSLALTRAGNALSMLGVCVICMAAVFLIASGVVMLSARGYLS